MEIPPRLLFCIILASAIAGSWLQRSITSTDKLKETVQEKTETNNDVVTTIKESANGERETIIVDHTKSTEDKRLDLAITHNEPSKDWIIIGGAGLSNRQRQVYMLGIERRVLGPAYIGAWVTTTKEYGLSLAFQF